MAVPCISDAACHRSLSQSVSGVCCVITDGGPRFPLTSAVTLTSGFRESNTIDTGSTGLARGNCLFSKFTNNVALLTPAPYGYICVQWLSMTLVSAAHPTNPIAVTHAKTVVRCNFWRKTFFVRFIRTIFDCSWGCEQTRSTSLLHRASRRRLYDTFVGADKRQVILQVLVLEWYEYSRVLRSSGVVH